MGHKRFLTERFCMVEGCNGAYVTRGMCNAHRKQWQRGHIEPPDEYFRPSEEQRFWRFVSKSENCWNWTGRLLQGYGRIFVAGRRHVPAHRYSYELAKGPIPLGMVIDHLCFNRACVNPAHLRVLTREENSRIQSRHCVSCTCFTPT